MCDRVSGPAAWERVPTDGSARGCRGTVAEAMANALTAFAGARQYGHLAAMHGMRAAKCCTLDGIARAYVAQSILPIDQSQLRPRCLALMSQVRNVLCGSDTFWATGIIVRYLERHLALLGASGTQ